MAEPEARRRKTQATPTEIPMDPGEAHSHTKARSTGRLILGTDKRDSVFAVDGDESGERLLVYYGFELMEIVNDDWSDPGFKLSLARLDKAGFKPGAICERFEVDPKKVRCWRRPLRQGDAAQLVRVLEGRGAGRKRTEGIWN